MSLKDTYKHLRTLLQEVSSDLEKSEQGNKAASQRVRTGTIRLEKVAKLFRKESVKSEKSGPGKKSKSKGSAKGSKGQAEESTKGKAGAKSSKASKSSGKSASKSKMASAGKKPTAKIIKKKK